MTDEPDSTIFDNDRDDDSGIDPRQLKMQEDLNDPITIIQRVYHLWWCWADFHLYIIDPILDMISPPVIIGPELIAGTQDREFVYPIFDGGSKLSTAKSTDMMSVGMSMCKLFMTIEKMIYLLVERLKEGGISSDEEVKVAFGGHLLSQRKAFEIIVNLNYNVIVTNFDPGTWGERYLQIIKQNSDKYGYPPEAPRERFKKNQK